MTVINPKSISGITSITTPSGSDDLLTIHNNSGAERLRIDGSGNTRITSGIITTVSVGAVTSVGAISGDVSIADKIVHTGDTDTAIRFADADTVTVETGGSERSRIDSSGRLLIGTTASRSANSAQGSFQIEGTGANDSDMSIIRNQASSGGPAIVFGKSRHASLAGNTVVQDDDQLGALVFVGNDGTDLTSQGARIDAYIDGTPGSNDMPGRLTFSTTADGAASATERLRINSVGKVGINSTAPDGMLAIEHTSSAPNLTMRNHPAAGPYTNEYGLELRHAYGTVKHGALIHTQEAADGRRSLDVSDSNGVFATFVNGKVGVGTDIPSYPLHVQDTSQNVVRFETTKATDEGVEMSLYKNSASPADGDQLGYIQFSGNDDAGNNTIYNAIIGYSKDVTNGTEDGELRFYSRKDATFTQTLTMYGDSGNLKIHNGNLVLGTDGSGIDFSATGDSGGMTGEVLDDYEEGTWTPALQFDVGSPTITYGTRSGTYVKVGRMVHLQYYMAVSSGTDVNDYFARLTLPFSGIGVGHQDARVRQWNTKFSEWFLSLGGAGPVFFMTNAAGSGVNYARGDDVDGVFLAGQYTLYV